MQPPQKAHSQPQTSQQDENDLSSQILRLRHRQQEAEYHKVSIPPCSDLGEMQCGAPTAFLADVATRAMHRCQLCSCWIDLVSASTVIVLFHGCKTNIRMALVVK